MNVLDWLGANWEWITRLVLLGGVILGIEKWRGQRLTNQKLRLELDALSLTLTKEERKRVASQITGKTLDSGELEAFKAHIKQWAKRNVVKLQNEVERLRQRLEESEEQLAAVRCPFCKAPVVKIEAVHFTYEAGFQGPELDHEVFSCGFERLDGAPQGPCPLFPDLDDYDLVTEEIS